MYKIAPRDIRLKVLAGLMDTDGSLGNGTFEIAQKSDTITNDILFLARSCGFAAYSVKCEKGCWYKGEYRKGIYNRTTISGHVSDIPTLIPRKQAGPRKQIKNVLHTGAKIEYIGINDYYGFTTDGNGRFLLDDFTVI